MILDDYICKFILLVEIVLLINSKSNNTMSSDMNRISESDTHDSYNNQSNLEEKQANLHNDMESTEVHRYCRILWRRVLSNYPTVDSLSIANVTDEDIRKYEEFKNKLVKCHACRNKVSIRKVILVKASIFCEECAKKENDNLLYLGTDIFALLDYTGEHLYMCRRMRHARPLYQYLEYDRRRDSYKIYNNCCYCRLNKSIRNARKRKLYTIKKNN